MPSHCPETGPSSLSLDANSPRTGHFNPFFQTLGFLIPPPRDFQRGVQRHVRGMWAGSQASSLTTAPPPPRETLQSPRRTEDEGARRPRRSGQGGGLRATPTGGRGLADPGLNGVTASSWGVQRLSGSSFSVAGHRRAGPGLSGGGAVEGTQSQGLWDRKPFLLPPPLPCATRPGGPGTSSLLPSLCSLSATGQSPGVGEKLGPRCPDSLGDTGHSCHPCT